MKKLYTLALAAAVAVSASAAQPVRASFDGGMKKAVKLEQKTENAGRISLKKRAAKAGEEKTIAGDYDMIIGDFYFDDSVNDYVKTSCLITDNGNGTITMSSPEFYADIEAEYNATTGDITFDEIEYGAQTISGVRYYVIFDPFVYDETNGGVSYESYSANFDKVTGEITFPADHGFWWAAYSKANYDPKFLEGYLGLFDVVELIPYVEPDFNEGWEDFTTGTFVDGWITPSLGETGPVNPASYPWAVDIQKSTTEENVYRLKSPYAAERSTINGQQGSIVFNITDPDFVVVEPGYKSGVLLENGASLYLFNIEGFFTSLGYEKDEINEVMTQNNFKKSTYVDGVVNIPTCRFDMNRIAGTLYVWDEATAAYMIASITFDQKPSDGINDVTISDNDGAVEYFNLQGVRVANPENGLYIRRQGNKAQKVLVK